MCLFFFNVAFSQVELDKKPAETEVPGNSTKKSAETEVPGNSNKEENKNEQLKPFSDDLSFNSFVDRVVGQAFRPTVFNWRKSSDMWLFEMGMPTELNNFESKRFSVLYRIPQDDYSWDLGIAWVNTKETLSSQKIGLTPYRQYGRPSRLELDGGLSVVLSEGISTFFPNFIGSNQIVLSAQVRFRYLSYLTQYKGLKAKDFFNAFFTLEMQDKELENIKSKRLPGMEQDPAHYNFLWGERIDLYAKNGMSFSQGVLVGLTLSTRLGLWWEYSIGIGYAYH